MSANLKIGIGDLVKHVYRHGGLFSPSYSSDSSAPYPAFIHNQIVDGLSEQAMRGEFFTEYPLKIVMDYQDISFEISGRADLIFQDKNPSKLPEIIEIKTISDKNTGLPTKADILHLAQAKLYAYIYCTEKDKNLDGALVTIKYYHIDKAEFADFSLEFSLAELTEFFAATLNSFYRATINLRNYKLLRNQSILDLKFPYPYLRGGQKDLMGEVLDGIRQKQPVFVQAPTGTGKTISVLYPAVKAIPHDYCDYIFYTTAKTSTQESAIQALNTMREKGLILKSLRITAKEKICPVKDIYCDTRNCPYAINYYDNFPDAFEELSKHFDVGENVLSDIGKKHKVCPFELGLDYSLFCDVIICDYNYLFDPRIRLTRFLSEEQNYRKVILADEAHNLPARINAMYTAILSRKSFEELASGKYSQKITEELIKLAAYFIDAEASEKSFDQAIKDSQTAVADRERASTEKPGRLLKLCDSFIEEIKPALDRITDFKLKKPLLELYFDVRFFSGIGAEFFDKNYISLFRHDPPKRDSSLQMLALNASDKLSEFYNNTDCLIYFSATLSPSDYYQTLFAGGQKLFNLRPLIFPSPFPPENRRICIVDTLSLKYQDRPLSLSKVTETVLAACSAKKGHYLVFSPSFAYQQGLVDSFKSLIQASSLPKDSLPDLITQEQGSSDRQRESFLKNFHRKSTKSLIGFAVLGGVFGEGIDLTGDKLSGVIIIGVGLPGKSFEQNIAMDYFNHRFGNGFDYAYTFPGFNKVLQAAGRVIRTEDDRGFVILIDERYGTDKYKALFPEDWDPVYIDRPEVLKEELDEFFGQG